MFDLNLISFYARELIRKALRRNEVADIMSAFSKATTRLDELSDAQRQKAKRLKKKADDIRVKAATATIVSVQAETKAKRMRELFGE